MKKLCPIFVTIILITFCIISIFGVFYINNPASIFGLTIFFLIIFFAILLINDSSN
jgi:hypothetical protein